MKMQIRCKFCQGEHDFNNKNFPLALYSKQEVFTGKGKNRKSLGIRPVVVGYTCKKCVGKYQREEFIKQHSINPAPGQSIMDAINTKIKQLKVAPKYKPPHRQDKPQPKGWERIKNITKNIFFKKRGRE